jgi:hypothetical protein
MSASQMLCFVRYFGLMVGDLIPENNKVWDLYISLRQIIDFVTCRSVQKESTALLSTIISEHNEYFVLLFDKPLKPKYHFLVHYCSIIESIGPLINIWSMRYEAKHKEFKNNARVVTCRKNLTYTLALKHQLIFNERLVSKRRLCDQHDIGRTFKIRFISTTITTFKY